MENPWYDFMKFGNATQNAYEYEHLYDVMHHSLKWICQTMKENNKKKIQDLIIAISRKMKKKNQQLISILHSKVRYEFNLLLQVYYRVNKLFK